MPQVIAQHPDLTETKQTYLSLAAASGITNVTIENTTGFNANDYVIIENIGVEKAELIKINTVTSPDTIVFSTNTKFNHGVDTSLYNIPYNKVRFYRSNTKNGVYTLIATLDIDVDYPDGTVYTDLVGTNSSWYKITYFNTTSTVESDYSDPFQGSGIPDYCLKGIQDRVLTMANDPFEERINRFDITTWVNEKYRMLQKRLQRIDQRYFMQDTGLLNMVANQELYDLPTGFNQLFRLRAAIDSSQMRETRVLDLRDDDPTATYNASSPMFYLQGLQIGFKPAPKSFGQYQIIYYPNAFVLTSDGDELSDPFKDYADIFVNYAMMRFCQIHKPQEVAVYKQFSDERTEEMITDLSSRQIQNPLMVGITDTSYIEALTDQSF